MTEIPETISFIRKRLPHWQVLDGLYFVTINRAGAIPIKAIQQIRAMSMELKGLKSGALLDQRRKILQAMETWLDHSVSVRDLIHPEVVRMLHEAIRHRQNLGFWTMIEYVIMPSHLHLFFFPSNHNLFHILSGFKRWTGKQAAEYIHLEKGDFWAREWFDHWSRSMEETKRIIRYTDW